MDKREILYTHRDKLIITLEEFVIAPLSLVKGFLKDKTISDPNEVIREVLNYQGTTEELNIERLWRSYDDVEQADNKTNYEADKSGISTKGYVPKLTLLPVGVVLVFPIDNMNLNVLVAESNLVIDTRSYKAFMAERLKELVKDTNYVPARRTAGTTKHFKPEINAWAWCKALSKENDHKSDGEMIDLSPFISKISYSTANEGSFSITLPPIMTEHSETWRFKDGVVKSISEKGLQYVSENLINTIKDRKMVRSDFYFSTVISENDLLFIRGESLKVEKRRNKEYGKYEDLEIPTSELPGTVLDFIGLVDDVTLNYSAAGNVLSITVTGRSLYKLLVEDGCYFYPLQFMPNGGLFANLSKEQTLQRIDGKLVGLTQGAQKSIDFSLKFIFNALSNTRICPDSLFSHYADTEAEGKKRGIGYKSKSFRMNYSGEVQEPEKVKGVWQIVKLLIDDKIANRNIVDSSIGNENGSLINHIDKVCQLPFVEFFGDTYQDQFYYIVRQPPYDKESFKDLLKLVDEENDILVIEEDDIMQENLSFDTDSAYSWYRLQPVGLIAGAGSEVVWAYLKAVYFKEYAELWGERPLEITTNYVDYKTQRGNKVVYSTAYFARQGLFDLKFLIDTHAYLPFTKKGTITINGDRRYKKGLVVYRPATDEVYYVDNVAQDYGIDERSVSRTTTLVVSRGMVRTHLDKYFSVIDTKIIEESYSSDEEKGYFNWIERELQNWKVNPEVFNFFVRREQFKKTLKMKSLKVNKI